MRQKMDESLFEEIYQTYLRVYHGQIIRREAAEHLSTLCSACKPNTYLRYLDSFLHMMDGTQFASVVSKNLSIYLLQRIQQDFGTDALKKALQAEKQHIQYYYDKTGNPSKGLCAALQKIALEFHLPTDFSPR